MDGVALETEKWIEVLRSMGYTVFTATGQVQGRSPDSGTETVVPEMSFFSPESVWSQKKAFFIPDADPGELTSHVSRQAGIILEKLLKWVREKEIHLLISENASSLPSHLEMGQAIHDLVKKTGIPTITHDHDYAWDRGDRYLAPNRIIRDFISGLYPLRAPHVVHAVINSHAAETLRENFNREAVYVPNVMDFTKPFGEPDQGNAALMERLGFRKGDLLLFQMTRLIRRKKIETAIELVHRLGDPKIKLVITGDYADDAGNAYYQRLTAQVADLGLTGQVRFAPDLFPVQFSLSDAYARASACTYFSSYEGFGNVVVEAILARRPLFVNNYRPVFEEDIGSKGIRTVAIEHGHLTDEAVKEMAEVIYTPGLAAEMAEHNYALGRKYFSFDTLREKLIQLTEKAFGAAGRNA